MIVNGLMLCQDFLMFLTYDEAHENVYFELFYERKGFIVKYVPKQLCKVNRHHHVQMTLDSTKRFAAVMIWDTY